MIQDLNDYLGSKNSFLNWPIPKRPLVRGLLIFIGQWEKARLLDLKLEKLGAEKHKIQI